MAHFKRTALQRFVHLREKSPPPVFVGRQAVIHDILTIADQTRQEKTGIPGNTTVITGAPGAGKSSVLSKLTRFNSSEERVKTLHISSVDLEQNMSDVLLAIGTLGRTTKRQLTSLAVKGAQRLGGLALLDVAGLMDVNLQTIKTLFREQEVHNIGTLHKVFPVSEWDTAVIVAVDEAQNLPSGRETPPSHCLRTLHEAVTKLPLILVLAGLGDTQSVIRSMGLTHGIQPSALGCFSRDELDELTEAWCDYFGIQIGSCRSRIDALMAPTDGWPRHVHWAQHALAEALLSPGIDGQADRITDWSAVQRRSDTLRHGYYAAQYSDVMDYSPSLTAQVLKDVGIAHRMGQPLNTNQLRQIITHAGDTDSSGTFECPPDHTANSFITHLIHCGALEKNPETGGLSCPIPSFQSYILRRGGIDPAALEPTVDGNTSSLQTNEDDSYTLPEPKPSGCKDDDPSKIP